VPAFVLLLVAVVVAGAGVLLWIELVLRAGAIYAAVAFLPLVLVAGVWPAVASWSRRLVETLAALVVSKLVVVLVLALGAGALGTSKGRGLPALMTGIGMLLLAGFAPFTLLKLLPLFEASAAGHLEGLRQRGTRVVSSGPPRQLVEMALAGAAGPVSVPMAATAGRAAATVGTVLSEDPMATAKRFRGDGPPGASPTRGDGPSTPTPTSGGGEKSGARMPGPTEPARWPRGAEEAPPSSSPSEPPRRPDHRPRTLRIEHDDIGPRIVPVEPRDG
jgi:type IV secretion system protein TrbL